MKKLNRNANRKSNHSKQVIRRRHMRTGDKISDRLTKMTRI